MSDSYPMHRPEMRIADTDRDRVAERLGYALAEGRLDNDEYHRRLELTMAAKTFGELEPLTVDLPVSTEERRKAEKQAAVEKKEKDKREWYAEWKTWIGAAIIMNAIWGFSSISSGAVKNYWPVWPLGIWAIILIAGIFWKDDSKKDRES